MESCPVLKPIPVANPCKLVGVDCLNLISLGLFMSFSAAFTVALLLYSRRNKKKMKRNLERKANLKSQLGHDEKKPKEINIILQYGQRLELFLGRMFEK